jgi:hypothetical protein
MAGIAGPWSDRTCNHHNALKNVPAEHYACGVTFRFQSSSDSSPFEDPYGVVSLQKCCDRVNATLMRIPGNTGCEMQFCVVPESTTTRTFDYVALTPTTLPGGEETYAYAPPVPSSETIAGPPYNVENCMASVSEKDVPDEVAQGLRDAGNWCLVRMYDTDFSGSEVRSAETAAEAPAAWTEAARDTLAELLATATRSDGARKTDESKEGGVRGTGGWMSRGVLFCIVLACSSFVLS